MCGDAHPVGRFGYFGIVSLQTDGKELHCFDSLPVLHGLQDYLNSPVQFLLISKNGSTSSQLHGRLNR